jgi:hypothetical protein
VTFKPTSDFVLDLIDGKERVQNRLIGYKGEELDGQRYLLVQPVPTAGQAAEGT